MINPEDLKIETFDPNPVGGMKVGYTHTGIRVTHIPSGISSEIKYARSQHAARQLLINMIEEALTDPLIDRVKR